MLSADKYSYVKRTSIIASDARSTLPSGPTTSVGRLEVVGLHVVPDAGEDGLPDLVVDP